MNRSECGHRNTGIQAPDIHHRDIVEAPVIRWYPGAGVSALPTDEVHVWRAYLPVAPEIHSLARLLSEDERDRAARFQQPVDRHRFIGGRALLRILLARYLHAEPEDMRFTYGPYGKPMLPKRSLPGFNVAHSGSLVLVSVAMTEAVGVDVEQIRDEVDITQVASHVYSPQEHSAVAALPPAARRDAFFTCWTRKEAWLKACGAGLTIDPTTFSVPLSPIRSFEMMAPAAVSAKPDRWAVWDIDPGDSYKGAVAIQGIGWKIRCWEWPWR